MPAGYSGTPLARKLSLKPGLRAWFDGMPESVRGEIGGVGLIVLRQPDAPVEAAHVFVAERSLMVAKINRLRPLLAKDGFI